LKLCRAVECPIARLAKEVSCNGKSNFEAVIETEIIETKSGPPHVLRLIYW